MEIPEISFILLLSVLAATSLGQNCSQSTLGQNCPESSRTYIDQPGDVIIVGLFNVYRGTKCEVIDPNGVRLIHAAQWTIDKLNRDSYLLPNISLGFKAIDVCGNHETDFQKLFQSLTVAGSALPKGRHAKIVGYIVPPNIEASVEVKELLQNMKIPYVQSIGGQNPAIKAIVKILQGMKCTKVTAIAFQVTMLDSFRSASCSASICLTDTILLHDTSMADLTTAVTKLTSDTTGTFVLFGNDHQIYTFLTVLKSSKAPPDSKWIVYGIKNLNKTLITEAMTYERFIVVHPEGIDDELPIETSFMNKIESGSNPLYTKTKKCDSSSSDDCDFMAPVDNFYVLQNAILPIYALVFALDEKNFKCRTSRECLRKQNLPIFLVRQKEVDSKIAKSAISLRLLNEVIRTNFSFISRSMNTMTKIGSYHQENLFTLKPEPKETLPCLCSSQCSKASAQGAMHFFVYYTWVIVSLTIGALN